MAGSKNAIGIAWLPGRLPVGDTMFHACAVCRVQRRFAKYEWKVWPPSHLGVIDRWQRIVRTMTPQ